MEREVIVSTEAPAAIGPYSQAIRAGQFVFCSGQIPLDPATGEVVGDDVETQARRVLRNLAAVLEGAGTSLGNVVKTTVFLQDLDDFAALNQAYAEFFSGSPPARSTVEAARLPRGVLVEIEAIALVPG